MRQLLKAQHEQIEQLASQLSECASDLADPRTGTGSGLSGNSFRHMDSPLRLCFSLLTMRLIEY
jgi:hypothetical protein